MMNHQFYFSILESLECFIFACDQQGKLIYLNKRAREKYGNTFEGQTFMSLASLAGGLFREDETEIGYEDFPLSRALRGEEVKDEVIFIAPPVQARMYLHLNASALRDTAGTIIGAMVSFEDVTEYFATTHKLQKRFKIIFDQAPMSIQIFNKQGQTIYINPAMTLFLSRLMNLEHPSQPLISN